MFLFCPCSHHPHKSLADLVSPGTVADCGSCHAVPAAGFDGHAAVFTFRETLSQSQGGLGLLVCNIRMCNTISLPALSHAAVWLAPPSSCCIPDPAQKSVVSCSKQSPFLFLAAVPGHDPAVHFQPVVCNSHAVHKA